LSRAIGDLEYKKNRTLRPSEQLISGFPEVTSRVIQPQDKFIVMGCDGVWEIQKELEICKHGLHLNMNDPDCDMSKIAEEILDDGIAPDPQAYQGLGCDNMSAIVVRLNYVAPEDKIKMDRVVGNWVDEDLPLINDGMVQGGVEEVINTE